MMLLVQCEASCYCAKIKLKSDSNWLQPSTVKNSLQPIPQAYEWRSQRSSYRKWRYHTRRQNVSTRMAVLEVNGLCRKSVAKSSVISTIHCRAKTKYRSTVASCYTQKQSTSPSLTFIQEKHIRVSSSGFCNVTHFSVTLGFPL